MLQVYTFILSTGFNVKKNTTFLMRSIAAAHLFTLCLNTILSCNTEANGVEAELHSFSQNDVHCALGELPVKMLPLCHHISIRF